MSRASGRKTNVPRQPAPGSPEGDEIGLSARQDPAGSPIPGLTGNITNYETVRQVPATPDGSFDEYRGMMAHGVPNASEVTEERALMERDGNLARQHRPPSPPVLHADKVLPAPVPVYITTLNAGGRPLGTISTIKVNVPAAGTDPVRIASRDLDRTSMYILVENVAGSVSNVLITPPTVPATGVAAQNTTGFPVSVVIGANGATITNVSVNGVTVGTAAGTYVVPAFGSISIAYTVATPTWTWTEIGVPSTAPSGVRISREVSTLAAGGGALLLTTNDSYQKLDNQQDELFSVSADGSACTLSLIFLYGETAGG